MSYRPPPKSLYGDTELTDDTWSQSLPTSQQPPGYVQSDIRGQASQPLYNQIPNPNYTTTTNVQLNQNQAADVATVANSITQEDILFMRGWQRDSFVYRVIPFSALGWGALYMYNKSKKLPHTITRYALVTTGTYLLGKWSYRGEFKQRLSQSRSNTPYMQALRKLMNLPPVVPTDSFVADSDMAYSNDASNWNASEHPVEPRLPGMGVPQQSTFGQSNQDHIYQPYETDSTAIVAPKQAATYEELRARNRGFIK